MTLEQKNKLESLYAGMMSREVNRLVDEQMAGRLTAAEVSSALSDVAEIAACIGTTYRALHLGEDL